MPLSMARFDFLSFWTDEALLPSHSRVTTCFSEGWIRGCRQSVIAVGRMSGLSRMIYGAISSAAFGILEGDVALMRFMVTVGWANGWFRVRRGWGQRLLLAGSRRARGSTAVMVHGVGLEDEDRPPHKQNKRGKGERRNITRRGRWRERKRW